MITAKEARELVTPEDVLKKQLELLEDSIKSSAKLGYTSTDLFIENDLVREKIYATMAELGYQLSVEGRILKVRF